MGMDYDSDDYAAERKWFPSSARVIQIAAECLLVGVCVLLFVFMCKMGCARWDGNEHDIRVPQSVR